MRPSSLAATGPLLAPLLPLPPPGTDALSPSRTKILKTRQSLSAATSLPPPPLPRLLPRGIVAPSAENLLHRSRMPQKSQRQGHGVTHRTLKRMTTKKMSLSSTKPTPHNWVMTKRRTQTGPTGLKTCSSIPTMRIAPSSPQDFACGRRGCSRVSLIWSTWQR
jgi:hypothetical protein